VQHRGAATTNQRKSTYPTGSVELFKGCAKCWAHPKWNPISNYVTGKSWNAIPSAKPVISNTTNYSDRKRAEVREQ
jgi:hypothetical protein